MDKRTILIVGASGTLGRHVVQQLLAAGHTVRAMTRTPARASALASAGAEVVTGNLLDIASLRSAMRDVQVVISASHAMLGRGRNSSDRVDDSGQRALIDVAEQAGVEHFVYTSVLGATPTHPVDFWRTKAAVEQRLQASGLGHTIVRPAAFMEMHAYELIGKSVASGKRVMLFGPGENPRNFVAAGDVASFIVRAIRDPSLRGETIDFGGPENLSARQVVAIFERVTETTAAVRHIPLPVLRVLSRVLAPMHAGVSRILRASIVGETTDQTFDATPLCARYDLSLTRLEDWARRHLRD